MIKLQIGEKELAQLREAFNTGTRGLWASIQSGEKFGVMSNETIVADSMLLSDAYLVDVMHHHFSSMLDDLDVLRTEYNRLSDAYDNQEVQLAAAKAASAHWREQHLAAVRAGELLRSELDNHSHHIP